MWILRAPLLVKLLFSASGAATGAPADTPDVRMRVEPDRGACEVGPTGHAAAWSPERSGSQRGTVSLRLDPRLRVGGRTLEVAGRPVDRGHVAVAVQVGFGLNRVPVVLGPNHAFTCEFLAAPVILGAREWIGDAVVLQLAPEVIDDRSRVGSPESVADVVEERLEQGGLDRRLQRMVPSSLSDYEDCRREIMDRCLLRVGATVSDLTVGDVDVRLRPADGQLHVMLALEDVEVPMELFARAGGVPISSRGTVTIGRVELRSRVAMQAAEGRLKAEVRGKPSVRVHDLRSRFGGVDGAILEQVLDVVQPRLQRAIERAASARIGPVAEAAVGVLVGRSGNMQWARPLLPGAQGSEALLTLHTRLSRLELARWGIGLHFDMRVVSNEAPQRAAVGVVAPLPAHPGQPSWSSARLAMNLAVANQALHALWQAGVFDRTLDGDALGPRIPEDAALRIRPELPPVLVATGKQRVELQLGDWELSFHAPSMFDKPIRAELHARASFELHAQAGRVERGPLRYEDLSVQILDRGVGALAAQMFRPWIRNVVAEAADQAARLVPASAPLPSVTISNPASSEPAKAWSLRLSLPHLELRDQHSVFTGSLTTARSSR